MKFNAPKTALSIEYSDGGPYYVTLNGEPLGVVEEITFTHKPPQYAEFYSGVLGKSFGFNVGDKSSEPPEVDLIDSSNPFAKALDAWQTGKAGWTKGAYHKKES